MNEEITSILSQAAADVESSGVPDDLRVAAFNAAVALRTSSGAAGAAPITTTAAPVAPLDESDWRGKIATAFKVAVDDVNEAFDLDGDRLRLTIPPSRLGRQKAAAMRLVAVLVSAARQASGVDQDGWTSVNVIREECRDLGALDVSNFATEIGTLDGLMSFKGSGRSRQLKVNRRGFEQAGPKLLEVLHGE